MAFTPAAHPPQPPDLVPETPFRLLVERAPDAILLVRDERILYANPAAAALLGAPSAAGPLDGFKAVNDRHGHRVGDLVLTAVAERLLQAVRRSDLVARLHGDEFVIATGDHLTTEAVAGVAERVLEALRSPVAVDGRQLEIRASIGIAVFPLDAAPAAELLARADAALYAVKAKGGDAWKRDTRLDPG